MVLLIGFSPYVEAADSIKVMVDGKAVSMSSTPVYVKDRLMIPMRSIFEALNAKVTWYNGKVIASLGQTEIQLTPNHTTALINGRTVPMAVPSTVINNTTMIPLRFIGETLGAEVDWLNDLQTVLITSKQFKESKEAKERYYEYAKFRNLATTYETTLAKYKTIKEKYNTFLPTIETEIILMNLLVTKNNPSIKLQAQSSLSKIEQLAPLQAEILSLGNSTVPLKPISQEISRLYTDLTDTLAKLVKDGVNTNTEAGWKSILDEKDSLVNTMTTIELKLAEERKTLLLKF